MASNASAVTKCEIAVALLDETVDGVRIRRRINLHW
jgi:hypothetical protein